jgi:alpha-tubulin suppressor-like RCC1 family protein
MRRCVPPRDGGQRRPARRAARAVLWELAAGGAVAAVLAATFLPAASAAGAAVLPGRAPGQQARAATGGALLAWGNNEFGQLGNGTTTDKHLPSAVRLPATTKITQVRAGCFHTVALTSTGQVLAWGLNSVGQLGNGTTTDSTTPIKVKLPVGVKVTEVRAGCDYSLALTSTGRVLAWGGNPDGELGNGTTTDSTTPVRVSLPDGTTVKEIAAGDAHSLALTSTGQMLAWGFNADGELGDGTTTDRHRPVSVALPPGVTVIGIAAGQFHSLAVTSTGGALAWGFNNQGELGNGTDQPSAVPVPVSLSPGTTVKAVIAGCEHSLAITGTGQVLAWGFNADGELGDGTTTNSTTPVSVSLPSGTTITAIRAGCEHSLAQTSTGQIFAWGLGDNGRLGNGGTGSSDVPVQVKLPTAVAATAIGAGPTAPVSFAVVRRAAS